MPRKANDARKAGAIEGIRWFFSEDRPKGAPPKPFWLTYTGDDVVEVPGVGKFQNGTRAEVDGAVARRFEGAPGWRVEARPRELESEETE